MRSVLGIDAAWTTKHPSGLALAAENEQGWHLVALASSYGSFIAGSEISHSSGRASSINVPEILATCSRKLGRPVDLVAVDMPLSRAPITCRRLSDDLVSKAYGSRDCGTHSPSALSPGKLSDELTSAFSEAGYALQTRDLQPRGLIEVYPHPALVELAGVPKRLPYKHGKIGKYWPNQTAPQRRVNLLESWAGIVKLLEARIQGISARLPLIGDEAKGSDLKSYEDMLDAIICAWVGICALEGMAISYGDEESAIWIPAPACRV